MTADNRALQIRSGTSADMEAAGKLGALLVKVHHDFDPERFIAPGPNTERAYSDFLRSQLSEKHIVLLVAERDNEVVGYSYAGVEGRDYMALRGPAGVVYDLVVDPRHRGKGIGGLLLEATVKALEERGAPRILLSTADKNEKAKRLFARAGFRRTMIEMTRELNSTHI